MTGLSKSAFRQLATGLVAATGLTMAAPAQAADIADSMSGAEIEQMLSGAGFSTTMIEDAASGAPVAMARLGQVTFVVRALDCDGRPVRCRQLLFFANFGLDRPITNDDYKVVNDFNDSSYDGRAYVLDSTGEIGIDFIIDLTGGVTSAHIESRLSRWQGVVSSFLVEMNKASAGS